MARRTVTRKSLLRKFAWYEHDLMAESRAFQSEWLALVRSIKDVPDAQLSPEQRARLEELRDWDEDITRRYYDLERALFDARVIDVLSEPFKPTRSPYLGRRASC